MNEIYDYNMINEIYDVVIKIMILSFKLWGQHYNFVNYAQYSIREKYVVDKMFNSL